MQLGVAIFPTHRTIAPDRLAREVEDRGFDSLWFPEHTHIPVDHSPYPAGGDLPEQYYRTFDPFVALGVVAAVTSRIRIGTGICLLAQRDPIVVAKEAASVDVLSGGRLEFGVGYGWNRPEMEHHGVAYDQRRDVLREKILAVKQLWTQEQASFDGEHVSFAPSYAWPKPAQEPHPPIMLGAGAGPRTFAEITEWADGWLPQGRYPVSERLPELRQAWEDAGRDPAELRVTVFGTKPDPGRIAEMEHHGVQRTVLWLPSDDESDVLRRLDEYTTVLDELTGT